MLDPEDIQDCKLHFVDKMAHVYFLFSKDKEQWLARLRSLDCAVEKKQCLGKVENIQFVSDFDLIGVSTNRTFLNSPASKELEEGTEKKDTWSIIKVNCESLLNAESIDKCRGVTEIVRTDVKINQFEYSFRDSIREVLIYVRDDGSIHLVKFQSSLKINTLSIQIYLSKRIFSEYSDEDDLLSLYSLDEDLDYSKKVLDNQIEEEPLNTNPSTRRNNTISTLGNSSFYRSSVLSEDSLIDPSIEGMFETESGRHLFNSKISDALYKQLYDDHENMSSKHEVFFISNSVKDLYIYCKWSAHESRNDYFYLSIFAKLGDLSKGIKIRMENYTLYQHNEMKILEVPNKMHRAQKKIRFSDLLRRRNVLDEIQLEKKVS